MLGKLIKYDLKSISGVLILIHGALLALSLAVRMIVIPHLQYVENEESIMSILLVFALIVVLVGACYATNIFICVRFYKNIYSDEGYLTNTLPVTNGQLLLSKTISGFIWGTINIIFVFLSLYLTLIQPVFHTFTETEIALFKSLFGFSDANFAILFIVSILLSTVSNVLMFYFSIILGQLFASHRIIGAIASYFVLNTIVSVFSIAAILLTDENSSFFTLTTDSSTGLMIERMSEIFVAVDIPMIIVTIIFYIASLYFMKKKRNLV